MFARKRTQYVCSCLQLIFGARVTSETVLRCGICCSINLKNKFYDKQCVVCTSVFTENTFVCWKDKLSWLSRFYLANHWFHIIFHHARLEVRVYATLLCLTFGTPLLAMMLYRYSSTFRKWFLVGQGRRFRGFKIMKLVFFTQLQSVRNFGPEHDRNQTHTYVCVCLYKYR